MTPLRQRYVDDLRLKNFSPGTIRVYVHAVAKCSQHFARSPDTLSREEVREYLVHLLEAGTNLRVIQQLLGHDKIQTTALYTHISLQELRAAPSTMELLQVSRGGDDPR